MLSQYTIVFIHRGCQSYLLRSIQHLRKNFSNSNVILVGDHSNNQIVDLAPGTQWVSAEDIAKNSSRIANFIESYKHYSINDLDYERFCFARWFLLQELIERNNLERVIYLDSDNLLLTDPEVLLQDLKGYDYGQTFSPSAPEFMFFNNVAVIDSFCEFLQKFYSNSSDVVEEFALKSTEKVWGGSHPSGAAVHYSDMWALLDFWENSQRTGNQVFSFELPYFKHICLEETMSDGSLNIHRFRLYANAKFEINGKRGVSILLGEERQKVNMIHFQGGDKKYLVDMCREFVSARESGALKPYRLSLLRKMRASYTSILGGKEISFSR